MHVWTRTGVCAMFIECDCIRKIVNKNNIVGYEMRVVICVVLN